MLRPKQFKPRQAAGSSKFVRKETIRSSHQLGYDRAWQTYRFRFLHHNPKCYSCGVEGGKSLHVDHIIAHKGDKTLFWKEDNYMPLCHRCHSSATIQETTKGLEAKMKWIDDNRKLLNITHAIKIVPFKH